MSRFGWMTFALVLAAGGRSAGADNEIPKEAREAFEKAAEFELYSVDPDRFAKKDGKAELLHGWKVLGKTTLKGDAAKRARAAVAKGIKDSDGSVAACFNPRHVVRVVSGKNTYDLVICYECHSATVYKGDERLGSFLTARGPEKTLNGILTDAKIPLPKSRD